LNCYGLNRETNLCNNYCKQEWLPWSEWSSCFKFTDKILQTRSRSCKLNGVDSVSNCTGLIEQIRPCVNNTNKTEWSEWSKCLCGTKNRVRTCSKLYDSQCITGKELLIEKLSCTSFNQTTCSNGTVNESKLIDSLMNQKKITESSNSKFITFSVFF
jgi:hypothetical protein